MKQLPDENALAWLQRTARHRYFWLSGAALVVVCYLFFDRTVADFFYQHRDSSLFYITRALTSAGKSHFYIIPFLILLLIAHFVLRNAILTRYAGFLLAASTLPGVVCNIFKFILSRPRPINFLEHDQYGFLFFQTQATYWSFPSGHATAIMGVMVALSLLIPRVWPLFIGFALIISFTRVTTSVHYLSDIITGMMIGMAIAVWLHHIFCQRFGMPPQLNIDRIKNRDLL